MCRVPYLSHERTEHPVLTRPISILWNSIFCPQILKPRPEPEEPAPRVYDFDMVFDAHSDQEQVFGE